jgi:hypothetical protein
MKNIVATFNAAAAISGSGPDSGPAVRETGGQVRGAMLKRGGPCSKTFRLRGIRLGICVVAKRSCATLHQGPRRNREGLRIHSASRTGEHDAVGPCATLRHHYDFARLHCSPFGTS